jgi:hypothetical protein
MEFGEVTTAGGIILPSDDGKSEGIKPRWAKVIVKGHENNDEYDVNDWVLVTHGRWSRGFKVQETDDSDPVILRTVEAEGVLGWSKDAPSDLAYYNNEAGVNLENTITAKDFAKEE